MALINITSGSFFADSRCSSAEEVAGTAEKALAEGADILDIGGCSTRPCSVAADSATEWQRVSTALRAVRKEFPDAVLSLDTFRPEIAEKALGEFGGMIINDVSGLSDSRMAEVVAKAGVPYVLTWSEPSSKTGDDYLTFMIDSLQKQIDILEKNGVKDIVVDPGFGFSKNDTQNWLILKNMHCLHILGKPVLAGISRKSMIQRALGCNAAEALNGTTAAHMIALAEGADILRVHDVKEAKQTILIHTAAKQ
jgi:dihydropteroate synthase